MKRITVLFFVFTLFFPFFLKSKTFVVGKNAPFKTIRAALQQAEAGDTISVKKGKYAEGNLVITKAIVLLGEGLPILDGQKKTEILSIKSSNVTVKGLQIERSGYAVLNDPCGIKVYNAQNVKIIDNILHDNFFGIYLQYSQHCLVKNNRITAFGTKEQEIGNGIHCFKSDSLQIIGNRIKGHRDGIYFEFVTESVIWRNVAEYNIRYGLHFMFSNKDSYFTNIFRNNGAGVAVMFTKNVTMMNNTFEQNWGDAAYGILLKEISDSYIAGNRFLKNTAGIFMDGMNRIVVERNTFQENGWAMKIQANCLDNVIQQNNFLANTFDVSTNGTTVLNRFERNFWDKYEGYDLDKNGIGDVAFRPLSMFSVIVEHTPAAMLLYRGLMVTLLDKSEKLFPTLTPDNFIDEKPQMKAFDYD